MDLLQRDPTPPSPPKPAQRDPRSSPRLRWQRHPIAEPGVRIMAAPGGALSIEPIDATDTVGHHPDRELVAELIPHRSHGVDCVVLLRASRLGNSHVDLLVNGYPPLGIVELDDRSEIAIGGEVLLYDGAGRSVVQEFVTGEESSESAPCARCKRRLCDGDLVRFCNQCASPHHEGPTASTSLPDLLCASYDPRCARCGTRWDDMNWNPGDPDHA